MFTPIKKVYILFNKYFAMHTIPRPVENIAVGGVLQELNVLYCVPLLLLLLHDPKLINTITLL